MYLMFLIVNSEVTDRQYDLVQQFIRFYLTAVHEEKRAYITEL